MEQYQVSTVANLFVDIFLVDGNEELSSSTVIDSAIELLNLVDENGNNFFTLDSNYNFDDDSVELLRRSMEEFLDTYNECKELFQDESKIRTIMTLVEEVVKTKDVIIPKNKISFITIPVDEKSSILDYDVAGKNAVIKNGDKEFKTNAPSNYVFNLSEPCEASSKTNAEHILSELEQLENALKYGDNPTTLVKSHSPFQTENKTFVRRNTSACTRIPFERFNDDNIIVYGIFHKYGQKDDDVQNEYGNRHSIISQLDSEQLIEDGKKAYAKFKGKLIKALYSDKLTEVEAIHTYLVKQAEERLERRSI